jgi:hypothetical protein
MPATGPDRTFAAFSTTRPRRKTPMTPRTLALTVLALVLALAIAATAPAAVSDRKPPRIVSASMTDADGDARTDHIRLTY